MFSCEFCEIFKNTFLQNTTGRLLLDLPDFLNKDSNTEESQTYNPRLDNIVIKYFIICRWFDNTLLIKVRPLTEDI